VARRTTPQRVRVSSQRIRPTWGYLDSLATFTIAANTKVLAGTFILGTSALGETILRVRGALSISSDQAVAPEEQIGAFGMGVFSDASLTTGIGALPDPVTNGDDDLWFVHHPFAQRSSAINAGGQTGFIYTIDSKAMRKVEHGYSVGIVLVNASVFHAVSFNFSIRILSKITQG